MTDPPARPESTDLPLRYLPAADLERCLPPLAERLELAAEALVALARHEAEMPPKIGVHPRPGALIHAMPAWLSGRDVVGLKWIAAYPDNQRHGVPSINGLVVLNDAETGLPMWAMDAARITAVRTAAVSGVAIRLLAPDARRVAIFGAGVQGRSHLELVSGLLPAATVALFNRRPDRAAALAEQVNGERGREWVVPAPSAAAAAADADVVITAATLGAEAQQLDGAALRRDVVVVAVDFGTYVPAALARSAKDFVVDDREQFLRYRDAGYFPDYPEPSATLGELAEARPPSRDPSRPVLVTHLGVGLADVLFADAIRRRAEEDGAGMALPR